MDDFDLGGLGGPLGGGEMGGMGRKAERGVGAGGKAGETQKLSFQESIERTMKGLKDGAEGAKKVSPPSVVGPALAFHRSWD